MLAHFTKTMPRVLNAKTESGGIYIGRPSKWGNPFAIGKDGTRTEVIAKYEAWLKTQPELLAALPELRGHDLRCWCAPQKCHGDILLREANSIELFYEED